MTYRRKRAAGLQFMSKENFMSKPVTLPKFLPIHLPGDVEMIFRLIVRPGETASFQMGSRGFYRDEEPRHTVKLTVPYYLGIFPVTQAQYRAMAGECLDNLAKIEDNKGPDPSEFKGEQRPVENVNWPEAGAVCQWLSGSGLLQDFGLPDGWLAGLPSEAQWEYACRAGTATEYWNGDGEAALAEVGWFSGNAHGETHPVDEKPANGFDLHDMHGNVREWCRDAWDEDAYAKRPDGVMDPDEPSADENRDRVVRGGTWFYSAGDCRSARRLWWWPGYRYRFPGFRVCLFPGPETSRTRAEAEPDRSDGGRGTSPELAGPSDAGADLPSEAAPQTQDRRLQDTRRRI